MSYNLFPQRVRVRIDPLPSEAWYRWMTALRPKRRVHTVAKWAFGYFPGRVQRPNSVLNDPGTRQATWWFSSWTSLESMRPGTSRDADTKIARFGRCRSPIPQEIFQLCHYPDGSAKGVWRPLCQNDHQWPRWNIILVQAPLLRKRGTGASTMSCMFRLQDLDLANPDDAAAGPRI